MADLGPNLEQVDRPAPDRAEASATRKLSHRDPLIGYRLRTVRIGILMTILVFVVLIAYGLLPGGNVDHVGVYGGAIALGAVGLVVTANLPWGRLFKNGYGEWAMYAWSAGDIALISIAVVATGGASSEMWALYALTTIFFAASYPPRAQAALLALTYAGYAFVLALTGWGVTFSSMALRCSLLALVFLMSMFMARELRAEMEKRSDALLRARLAEAAARRSEWFRSLIHDSSDIVTSFDIEGRILYVSPAIRSMGYEPDDLVGTYVSHLVHPDDLSQAISDITEQFETHGARVIEYRAKHADGSYRYVEGTATNLLSEPTVNAVVVNTRDVTERKRAEMLLASQSQVLERIASGAPLDAVLRIITTMVEQHVHALCTVVVNGAPGTHLMVVSSDPRERDELAADDAAESGWSREIISASGDLLGAVRLRFGSPRFATEGDQQVAEVAANLVEIAIERDTAEARLAHQARHDTLTGLANRQVFMDTLEHALTSAVSHETIAVLFIDLDGFKDVNDNLGHHVGDHVLVALGHRLAGALRKHDIIARFGGDEFVALCRVEGPDHALQLADRVLTRVREPISAGSSRVQLDASIGITLAAAFPDEGPRWVVEAAWVQAAADELLREADIAMYQAKDAGGGQAVIHVNDPPPRPYLRAADDATS